MLAAGSARRSHPPPQAKRHAGEPARATGTIVNALPVVPTLDEIAAGPAKVDALPIKVVKQLLVRNRTVGDLLLARLISEPSVEPKLNGADRFLNAAQVGAMIGKSRSWVEKNIAELPPRRKVGGEGMWSEREIQTWMKHREPWE
jgi:predicted DNA-binding transcriptional regulator AlpA